MEDEALKRFKEDLFDRVGHYWCNYATDDAMKLHFVMQLETDHSIGIGQRFRNRG